MQHALKNDITAFNLRIRHVFHESQHVFQSAIHFSMLAKQRLQVTFLNILNVVRCILKQS